MSLRLRFGEPLPSLFIDKTNEPAATKTADIKKVADNVLNK